MKCGTSSLKLHLMVRCKYSTLLHLKYTLDNANPAEVQLTPLTLSYLNMGAHKLNKFGDLCYTLIFFIHLLCFKKDPSVKLTEDPFNQISIKLCFKHYNLANTWINLAYCRLDILKFSQSKYT